MTAEGAYYEFDMGAVRRRLDYLREHLPEGIALAYAVKANTFLIRDMIPWVERFEVCSPGELRICDKLGVPPEKTVISGVYKTPEFIEELAASPGDRLYTVESMTQFRQLRELSERYGKRLPVLLRLTNDSQFGINEEDIRRIVENRGDYPLLELRGVQFFSGTQKTSLKKLARELRSLDDLLHGLQEDYGYRARELEYGPGFPVAYYKEEALDEEALLDGFAQLLTQMRFSGHVTLELGRSIAACCGKYFTRVVDLKHNRGQNYLLVDGGMHHITYFGQYMAMKQPHFSVFGKEDAPKAEKWNIVGSLCSMNDILVKLAPLPEMAIGDALVFENAGAYCMTEGMSLFLSRDLPAIYIIGEDGELYCARASFETCSLNTPQYERMR